MILEDVMLTFNRRTRTFKFYADNQEQMFTGDFRIYRAFKLFSDAMQNEESDEGGLANELSKEVFT